jgi:hypothetical protein
MTKVVPLAQGGSTLDRRLLLAARSDRPPPGAEDAALAILDGQAALAAANACAERATRHAKPFAGKLVVVKLLLAVVAACGAGVVGWTMTHRGAGTGSPPVAREVPSLGWPAVAPSAVAEALVAATAQVRVPGEAPRAQPRPSSSQDVSDLALEVALLERAAQALGAGDASGAIAALDEARSRCKRPVLVQEAGLLRARALAMRGQTPEAAALARHLRDADPHGVLANRFGAIVDAGAVP